DSRPAEIPVALLNGCYEGPTLYIQAAVDGDELNPIAVARDVIAKIDPKKLSGKIIVVILTNFFGFHSKQPWNPIDNMSMNRVWPGRQDGYSSERIVHKLWNEAVLQSNYAIDIHQTGTNPSVGAVYVRVAKNEPFHDETLEMAKIFGMGYILDEKLSKIYAGDLLSEK
ncbi:MAG: deacylase, partial [Aliifodinibius sp.]|nr:deacylase [Fodinibius sp.]